MPRYSEQPRRNVLSVRVTDDLRSCVDHARDGASIQDFLHQAVEEKLIRERQNRIDNAIAELKRQPAIREFCHDGGRC